MINSALNLLPAAVGQGRPQIIPSFVAPNTSRTPLPVSFSDPLYVVSPTDNESFWKVLDWPIEHGGTLPLAGAACALYYDANGVLRCVWWDGGYSPPSPGGVAGGDLSGTYPSPTFSAQGLGKMLRPANNLSDLQSAAAALLNLGIARGSVSFTFSASTTTPTQTVTHGLATQPRVFLQNASGATDIDAVLTAFTATTFTAEAYTTNGVATSGATQFYWLAVL